MEGGKGEEKGRRGKGRRRFSHEKGQLLPSQEGKKRGGGVSLPSYQFLEKGGEKGKRGEIKSRPTV